MKTVSLRKLKLLGACTQQLKLFRELFGDRCTVSVDLCVSHAAQFDWNWAAQHLLTQERDIDYRAKCAPLYTDWQAARDALDADWRAKRAPLDADWRAKCAALYTDYHQAKRAPLDADYQAKCAALYADYRAKRAALDTDYWVDRARAFATVFLLDS